MPIDPAGGAGNPVTDALEEVLRRAAEVQSGAVADYIPELALIDPELLAISATSVLGHQYSAGSSEAEFTIQSISKPFVYALALADLGVEEVHSHVGFEPSGEPFNAISLDPAGRPANPLINAGAIVTSALIDAPTPQARFERIRSVLSAFAGRELQLDERVYASESETGHRNRALGHLTLAAGALPRGVADATEVYFQQCALLVTAADLAMMGATLANAGVNPVTNVEVVTSEVARQTLSLMTSCGMYDRAGEWAFRVGMPAKSGVGGGIVAVKPGQFGVGVFSPRLDEAGNSARGTRALTLLSQEFELNLLEHHHAPASPIQELAVTASGGMTVSLRGEIDFIAVEQLVHDVREAAGGDPADASSITIDLTAVTRVGLAAARLLTAAAAGRSAWGSTVQVVDPSHLLAVALTG
ncbi:L-glutaminase [Jatrophihabitans sp. GAS493]|uniref:glutaminase A n=1 Tax=Jatrophihabitans sp. GAS493 TaxID=1907575 RepID=UPI000BBFF21B|nr:glutaminase A [Jatrophihabitans sp. GAS493]SOD72226.1 L-glutaminase [Jatrophihabitans sp. GAS493]